MRSLRFLDNLLQRDNLQKAAFLKDALKFWPRFDMRVLRYKVLPPWRPSALPTTGFAIGHLLQHNLTSQL